MARPVTWSKVAMLLVSGALVLGGCALQSGVPGGAAGDSSSYGVGGGQSSSLWLVGPPRVGRENENRQSP